MLKPASLARGQVAGMANAFEHLSHSSTGEPRMTRSGEDFRCLLTGSPEKCSCLGSTDLGLLCLAEPLRYLGPHDFGGDSELASEIPPASEVAARAPAPSG